MSPRLVRRQILGRSLRLSIENLRARCWSNWEELLLRPQANLEVKYCTSLLHIFSWIKLNLQLTTFSIRWRLVTERSYHQSYYIQIGVKNMISVLQTLEGLHFRRLSCFSDKLSEIVHILWYKASNWLISQNESEGYAFYIMTALQEYGVTKKRAQLYQQALSSKRVPIA